MKKLICVWGSAGYGKTSSIIELDKILNNQCTITNVVVSVGTYSDDICRVYEIQYGNQKYTIGIESQGDPNSRQAASLQLFNQNNCNIIVCASRTRGQTVTNVDNFCHNHNYDLFWISTLYSIPMYGKVGAQMHHRTGQILFDILDDFMNHRY